jgi:hypothetical protein
MLAPNQLPDLKRVAENKAKAVRLSVSGARAIREPSGKDPWGDLKLLLNVQPSAFSRPLETQSVSTRIGKAQRDDQSRGGDAAWSVWGASAPSVATRRSGVKAKISVAGSTTLRAVDKQSYRWKSRTVCIESCISNADQNSHSVSASEFPRITLAFGKPFKRCGVAGQFRHALGIPAPKATCQLTQGSAIFSFCVKHCEAQPETHRRTLDSQPSPTEAAGGRHRAPNIRPEVH